MRLLLVLAACADPTSTGSGTVDSAASDPTDSAAEIPRTWHALLTADGLLSEDHPPLVEVDAQLERVWQQDLGDREGRGAQGIDRDARGRTAFTRVTGTGIDGWVDLLDADGELAWTWDGDSAGGLDFPHGVAWSPDGDLVVADTANHRLLAVDLDGQLLWEEPLPSTSPNGLALWTDPEAQTWLGVTGRHALTSRTDDEERVARYRWTGRHTAPELAWSVVPVPEEGAVVGPHGPTFLPDGTLVYCAREEGQLVQLGDEGAELWRSARDRAVVVEPQDVAVVDADTWLVADSGAGQLLRFEDPFGAFENTGHAALDGIFSVTVVTCAPDGGLPCY